MSNIAVYPGTFDPITNGHVDIIRRGAKLFDQVIVGVAESTRKAPSFTLTQRIEMCAEALADIQNVTVESLSGLTVDFAKQHHAHYILRGLRMAADFDYEFQIAGTNHKMAPEIETIFLPTSLENAFISGTMVREIMSLDSAKIAPFVPACVLSRLV